MKKGVIVVVILCVAMISFNTGCTDKKPEHVDSVSTDSIVADTIKDSDTVAMIVEETPMPKAADELFDDFFFNFINSEAGINRKASRATIAKASMYAINVDCATICL